MYSIWITPIAHKEARVVSCLFNPLRAIDTECNIMATGRAIVQKSLDQLKSTITHGDAHTFRDTNLEEVWQAAREIEQEQGARLDLRFMRRLEPLLQTLESYAPTIEVFCQGFSPMAFVWVIVICLSLPTVG